ncbi:MAG: ScpA family protein [Sphaerobacter sp.]|nr:ScpA family protein [Sphaerobacter sp.]
MAVTVYPPLRLADCQLRLPTFEGPLDVLLRMIERSQLDITGVSLVAVTDQFLAYVAALSDVPPELLAEFTAVASRLLALKSRSLLPAPPQPIEEPEPDDLTRQLQAYQAVRAGAAYLQGREREGLRSFGRPPARLEGLPVAEHLAPVPLPALLQALWRCLSRRRPARQAYRPAPIITLAEMTRRLLARLGQRGRFRALLGDAPSRTEYLVGFIALLSLLRQRVLDATQETLFGEIEVWRIGSAAEAADD